MAYDGMSWQGCIDPSRVYSQEEIAALVGVDAHEIACTMQLGIIPSTMQGGQWRALGEDLLEWGKAGILCDDFAHLVDLPEIQMRRAPEPKFVEEVTPPPEPSVYFALCGDHVKIGFTRGRPEHRLKGLATANPLPVVLIATLPGTQELEQELHARFDDFRTHGEWFVFSDEIRAYVASIEHD